jgi:hypothetical protein
MHVMRQLSVFAAGFLVLSGHKNAFYLCGADGRRGAVFVEKKSIRPAAEKRHSAVLHSKRQI